MADHASAVKRNRQRIKRTLRNRGIDNKVKSALKKARAAVAGANKASGKQAKDLVLAASKALARAASKGAMHSRAASRKISRLNSALSKSAAK
jgi:small subunit ribosomal protein S20